MRVLILNERDPLHPSSGGAETHVHEIFSRLVGRGHEVRAFVSAFDGGAAEVHHGGIALQRLARVPTYYARAAWACARHTRRGEFDVVLECLNKLPYLAPLYSHVPVLGLCHHLFGSTAFQQVAWPVAAATVGVERGIPWAYRKAPLVAISESTRDDLVARGLPAERIAVQHPGIRRPGLHPPPVSERDPLLVYVGRLEAYKNVALLLDVVARLAPEFPALQLAIVGRGSERPRLEAAAAASGIAERVTFTGFVPDAERDAWLARARVCVCPSAKEGFGLTVVEANALGTPNVATDAPGLRDTVRDGETGFLAPEGDAEAFAARIGELLRDAALAERFSKAGLAWSDRFDWERAADAMEGSLQRAIAGDPTP